MKKDVIQITPNHDTYVGTEKVIRSVVEDLMLDKLSTRCDGHIIDSYYNNSCYSIEYDSSSLLLYETAEDNRGEARKLVCKEEINEEDLRVLDTVKNLSEIYNLGINIKNYNKKIIIKMKEKKEILKIAIDAIKECIGFEDKVKREFGLDIYDMQPSMSAGELFDCVTDLTLNEQGQDILYSFVFPFMKEYNENNPFEVKLDDEIIEIHSNSELVDFLYEHGYFLK